MEVALGVHGELPAVGRPTGRKEQIDIEGSIVLREDDGALDHIFKLANVAGIVVIEQRRDRSLGVTGNPPAVTGRVFLEKMSHQERQVFPTLA